MKDNYVDCRAPGAVINSSGSGNAMRGGVDRENVISIDNGALRIAPLIRPGWGRSTLAYGPYERQAGLTLAVFMLNGHNTSQFERLPEGFPRRIWRWMRGSEANSIANRMGRWLRVGDKRAMIQRIRAWLYAYPKSAAAAAIDENLAVGWFSDEVPSDPTKQGHAFVVHAGGPRNGDLWMRIDGHNAPMLRGLQNIPTYYLIVLRPQGAMYYAATVPGVHYLPEYPYVRPLAIDPVSDSQHLYAAISQSVLGQIGFRVDTRVYATQIEPIAELSAWYGTAHVADSYIGEDDLDGSAAEIGGAWSVTKGRLLRSHQGLRADELCASAMLFNNEVSGLLHLLVEPDVDFGGTVALIWRLSQDADCWRLALNRDGVRLEVRTGGQVRQIAETKEKGLLTCQTNAILVSDDGLTVMAYLNGQLLFDQGLAARELANETGLGIEIEGEAQAVFLRNFEAHPRRIRMPAAIELPQPWFRQGDSIKIEDEFNGPASDLNGCLTSLGNRRWCKMVGGSIIRTGQGTAKVDATAANPAPGRTAYLLAWENQGFADLETTILPPGRHRGEGEQGRGGLIFLQDQDNYITVSTWLSDNYRGASVSSFFHLNGFEELFDAVWTNVDQRIYFGRSYRLRVTFDGQRFMAFVNDEPVLYRALSDVYPNFSGLRIRAVGIVANWEWGCDTGSEFERFLARE